MLWTTIQGVNARAAAIAGANLGFELYANVGDANSWSRSNIKLQLSVRAYNSDERSSAGSVRSVTADMVAHMEQSSTDASENREFAAWKAWHAYMGNLNEHPWGGIVVVLVLDLF